MRYAVISDIHSNLEALAAVVGALRKEGIDKFVCPGDIVGYGANPAQCLEIVRGLRPLLCAGNHDMGCAGKLPLEHFNSYASCAVLHNRGMLGQVQLDFLGSLKLVKRTGDFSVVHGTLKVPEEFDYMSDTGTAGESFGRMNGRLCFIGHTHIAGFFRKSSKGRVTYTPGHYRLRLEKQSSYIVNPGSVGQPRDGNPAASFCIFDTLKEIIEFKRVDYDIRAAREKIIAAGLPAYLGDRLMAGR